MRVKGSQHLVGLGCIHSDMPAPLRSAAVPLFPLLLHPSSTPMLAFQLRSPLLGSVLLVLLTITICPSPLYLVSSSCFQPFLPRFHSHFCIRALASLASDLGFQPVRTLIPDLLAGPGLSHDLSYIVPTGSYLIPWSFYFSSCVIPPVRCFTWGATIGRI